MNLSDFLIWCFFAYFEVISKKFEKGIIIWPSRSNKTAIFSHFCIFRTLKFFQVTDFYDFNMMFLGMFRSDNWENCPKFGLVFAYSLRKNKHHSGDLSSMCLFFLGSEEWASHWGWNINCIRHTSEEYLYLQNLCNKSSFNEKFKM